MPSQMAAQWGAVLPPSESYWLVNASLMNYGRWVGQNLGPIFSGLWTKVHQIKFACAGVSVVYNTIFRLTTSCVPETFAVKSLSCPKSRQISRFLGSQLSGGGEGHLKCLTEFHKFGSPSNMWQSLVTIGHATSEIRRPKKGSKRQR